MGALRILVVSPEPSTARFLEDHLVPARFEIAYTKPGVEFVQTAQRAPIRLAVIDRIDGRLSAAQIEIAVLKQLHPEVQVIAVSTCSSEQDACIVELGIFYYLAGQSNEKLVRVIKAAAAAAPPAVPPSPRLQPTHPSPP